MCQKSILEMFAILQLYQAALSVIHSSPEIHPTVLSVQMKGITTVCTKEPN